MNGMKRVLKTNTRDDCIRRWREGKGFEPSEDELHAFQTGFNMAWKHKPTKVFVNRDSLISELLEKKHEQNR